MENRLEFGTVEVPRLTLRFLFNVDVFGDDRAVGLSTTRRRLQTRTDACWLSTHTLSSFAIVGRGLEV